MVSKLSDNNFHTLKSQASKYVKELSKISEKINQKIAAKNLFNSMLPSEHISLNANIAFKIQNIKQLEFGSSSLYLKGMRNAVKEILKDHAIKSDEKQILEKWLKTTKPTQQMTWILDYFRARIPFVLSNILAGQNPENSYGVKLVAPYFTPNDAEFELLSDFIIKAVENLVAGEYFAIPSGSLFHETIISITKDQSGNIKFYLNDPNKREVQEATIDNSLFSNSSFLKNLLRSKFQSNIPLRFEMKEFQSIPQNLLLRRQMGNICFAHCYWSFFRFFILNHYNDLNQGVSTSQKLETKIKEKIFELSPCTDSALQDLFLKWLTKKRSKQALKNNKTDLITLQQLTLSIINRLINKKIFISDKFETIKCLEKNLKNIVFLNKNDSYHKDAKEIIKIAKYAFLNLEEKNQDFKSECTSVSASAFFEFIKDWNDFEKILKAAFFARQKQTLESIEKNYGWISSTLNFANGKNSYNKLIMEAYLNNVSYSDYFSLFSQVRYFLFMLSTPQEVLNVTKRLIAIASRASPILKNILFILLKSYFTDDNQFDSSDPDWVKVENEFLTIINNKS